MKFAVVFFAFYGCFPTAYCGYGAFRSNDFGRGVRWLIATIVLFLIAWVFDPISTEHSLSYLLGIVGCVLVFIGCGVLKSDSENERSMAFLAVILGLALAFASADVNHHRPHHTEDDSLSYYDPH